MATSPTRGSLFSVVRIPEKSTNLARQTQGIHKKDQALALKGRRKKIDRYEADGGESFSSKEKRHLKKPSKHKQKKSNI